MSYKGFTSVQLRSPKKSKFDLTHDKRLSTRMGRLTPIMCLEAIRGDKFFLNPEMLIRVAPMIAPIYEQLTAFVHMYFVPNRLLWEDWEEFITGGRLGVGIDPVNAPVPPWIDIEYALLNTNVLLNRELGDYLGVPDLYEFGAESQYAGLRLDILPFAAYYLVWYEYYRDRNYIADNDLLPLPSGEFDLSIAGNDELMLIKTRDYLKDYFTSALPFTQRGEEVLMPLEGTGTVTYLSQSNVRPAAGGNFASDVYLGALNGTDDLIASNDTNTPPTAGVAARVENIDEVLLTASSVSINDFRSAYALQVWLERNAVGGSRYTESIQAHFAVKPQDSRLQRPEFLGGGRMPIRINEVVNTAWSQDGTGYVPAGNLSGHGVAYSNVNGFRYFCSEHGFIISILSIMNPPTYQQGIPKMFYDRRSFLSYPWPTFAKLGEQQVDKAELYASGPNLTPDSGGVLPLFGYQSRYADWKYIPNMNHSDFRTDLAFWTMTRVFASSPVLGEDFVKFDQAASDQVFAVQTNEDNWWLYIHNKLSVDRALPYFGAPNTLNFG